MSRLLPLLFLLIGCPYIFGPPEVPSGPDSVPLDADTDTDADTDADTDTDSGTTPAGTTTGTTTTTVPLPPEITLITTTFHYGFAHLVLDIQSTGTLEGGVVTVDDGGVPIALSIPTDLAAWDPSGIATLEFPTGTPCTGLDLAWTLSVTDSAGRQGANAYSALVVPGLDHNEPDRPNELGSVPGPLILCGELGNSNDNDGFTFTDLDGDWTFSLHDETVPPANRDMELEDSTGTILASATTANDPDAFSWTFDPTETYEVNVFSPVGGSGSPWQVVIHR